MGWALRIQGTLWIQLCRRSLCRGFVPVSIEAQQLLRDSSCLTCTTRVQQRFLWCVHFEEATLVCVRACVRACARVRATRSSSLPFPLILFFTTECAATNILRALCTDVCPCSCKWCLSSSFVKFTSQEGVYKTKRFGSCTTTSVVRCFGTEWLLYSWPVTGEFHKRWWQQVYLATQDNIEKWCLWWPPTNSREVECDIWVSTSLAFEYALIATHLFN